MENGKNRIDDQGIYLHSKNYRVEIGEQVLNKERIYLDTKYWIYLRDAVLKKQPSFRLEIYYLLQYLVDNGIAICPLSYHVFAELMKQPFEKRMATAIIMDELSKQVCFINPSLIQGQEIVNFISQLQIKSKGLEPFNSSKYVWTKIGFIFGEQFPTFAELSDNDVKPIRVGFFNYLSQFTLVQMLEKIGDKFLPSKSNDIEEKLNIGKDTHQNWKTFRDVYRQEIKGILDLLQEEIKEVILFKLRNQSKYSMNSDDINLSDDVKKMSWIIYQSLDNNTVGKELPSIRISCGLHAYFRYNKGQRFKKNDLIDFGHAAWALPYCHAFFTERRLAEWVCNSFLQFDRVYETKVLSDDNKVLEYLHKLQERKQKIEKINFTSDK
ncbi:MAG: hypothetical protein EPO24_03955 [Bacteroidetes bacterium]|nr:MAG: hypothetical protein EPO24_03955 [Bacteroidota bacterium]